MRYATYFPILLLCATSRPGSFTFPNAIYGGKEGGVDLSHQQGGKGKSIGIAG